MKLFRVELVFIIHAVSCFETSPLIKKALDIASSTYELNHATSVVWRTDKEEVASFLRNFNGTVVLTSMQNTNAEMIRKFNKMVGYQQTVFFVSRVEEFTNFISMLKLDIIIPFHLILVLTYQATDAEVSSVTKIALENDLANIIVVSANDTENIELSTYFPNSNGICGNHAPVKINSDDKKWFPKKFSNFQGCPIKVSLLHVSPYVKLTFDENDDVKSISGLDGSVFTILIRELNASMDIVTWRYQAGIGTYINGTATGGLGDLVNRYADILAPAVIISDVWYSLAQISPVFETLDVYWFGPYSREIDEDLRVLQPFMNDMTPVCIVTFIVFIIATKIVIRCHKVYLKYGVTFQSLIMFLGQEVQFLTESWLANSLFVMWIWFCLILRTIYQGELFDGLENVIMEKPLTSLEDSIKVLEEGYGGSESYRELYRGTSYFQDYKVLKKEDVALYMKEISAGKRFLLAADKLLAYELSIGVQMVDDPIMHAPACFFMRPGWPAAEETSIAIQRLTEAGLTHKVLNDNINEWKKKEIHHSRHEIHPLDMDTMIVYFYGLGFAYFGCVSVLIVEIVYNKLSQKYKRKD